MLNGAREVSLQACPPVTVSFRSLRYVEWRFFLKGLKMPCTKLSFAILYIFTKAVRNTMAYYGVWKTTKTDFDLFNPCIGMHAMLKQPLKEAHYLMMGVFRLTEGFSEGSVGS